MAQSGKNCEIDVNDNAMTFITPSSFFQQLAGGDKINPIFQKDIQICIRTHMDEALIFYANDHKNNFVQLHIENGTSVVFTYNTLDRVVRGVVEIGPVLVSGSPIQIKVDRSPVRTIITANGMSTVVSYPINFLEKYNQKPWISGDHLELIKPARPPFPTEAHNQLFLGGVDYIGVTSKMLGIVGCLQGFLIDGKLFDLIHTANIPEVAASGQIKPGCSMLCDKQPCANGGLCTEDWKNNKTVCNCTNTSYSGATCRKDIGARFNGRSLISYIYTPDNIGITKYVFIHLAFSSDGGTSNAVRTLLIVNDIRGHILIGLTSDGGILVEELYGDSKS